MTPEAARKLTVNKHFVQRCRERGIEKTDPDELFAGLVWAKANGRDDIAELAKKVNDAEYWRFWCEDGMFFAVFVEGSIAPVTVMTHEMYRRKRWRAKLLKKGHKPAVANTYDRKMREAK